MDNQEKNKTNNIKSKSFIDTIYDEISSVIGVNSDNQFLCLQIPGTILNADDYSYDIKKNPSKPLIVEANESRLANKMFDPCKITGSDNGFSLPYQYGSALDILTPKLNKQVTNFKNKLRQLLLGEYPYDFGNGLENKYTLQQVYFKLYDDYIKALSEWSKEQNRKKEELQKKYPLESEFKEAYIEWYETEAERFLIAIDEKKSKILTVFSPNDMKILEGVLDSGSGAELQESRNSLKKARKLPPTGGYVYPVRFVPTNWFEMIGTSFTLCDLIKSPEDLFSDLQDYSLRRMQLCFYLQNAIDVLNEKKMYVDNGFDNLTRNIKQNKNQLDTNKNTAIEQLFNEQKKNSLDLTITEYIDKTLIPLTEIQTLLDEKTFQNILIKTNTNSKIQIPIKIFQEKKDSNNGKLLSELADENKNYIDSIKSLIKKIEPFLKEDSLGSFASLLKPTINQFNSIDDKINEIFEQIKCGMIIQSIPLDNKSLRPLIPKGFTQVTVSTDIKSLNKHSSYTSSNSVSTKGFDFLFTDTHDDINKSQNDPFKNCNVNISMNIAKVGIERDWFNPEIFALTKNMIKLGTTLISPERDDYTGFDDNRLKEMSKCIFPCYPVAMIIARDISISFDFKEDTSFSEQYKIIEKQALSGSFFLLFRNMSGNSTMQQSSSHVSTHGQSIVVRIDSTQLIGYCLEATRADKSETLESVSKNKVKNTESTKDTKILHDLSNTILMEVPKPNAGDASITVSIKEQPEDTLNETKLNIKDEDMDFSSILKFTSDYQTLINQSILEMKQKRTE